jgi:CheY-like chemotaxis protein
MEQEPLVLVIEHDLQNIELLNSFLRTLNISCICTKQGLRALNLANIYKPRLILLDVLLLDINPVEVINYLKTNTDTAKIPIIAVTTSTRLQNQDFVFIGADDCIIKPYDYNQLKDVIYRYLN